MLQIKVCGLMDPQRARVAARLGAGMIGLVLAPSRRRVSPELAKEIAIAVRGERVSRPSLVGVFVNQSQDEVNGAVEACGLDYVQLSGDESPEYCRGLLRPFIKAFRLSDEDGIEAAGRVMDSYLEIAQDALFLLDTHVPGLYGGSGLPWDWERASSLARRYRLLIAGGLTPETVAGAVKAVNPWGVDVSSGVETDEVKDESKIAAFIEAARAAN